jgi:RHH-type rel operon transcriptional repressor/antitoxin RelB
MSPQGSPFSGVYMKNEIAQQGTFIYYTCIAKEVDMLALRLPEDIERRLEALAKRSGRSKSFYAREAILEHLDDLEAAYLSDEILKRVESGQEQTYTLEDLEKELGLAD